MSNLICDFYDDEGVTGGRWHWTEVLCRGCFDSLFFDSQVRVSESSASAEKCERCGNVESEEHDTSLNADADEAPSAAQPQKLFTPNPSLALLIGSEPISFVDALSKVWMHIKANNLQDPASNRTVRCDSALEAAIGVPTFDMFALSTLLRRNLTSFPKGSPTSTH